jgi:hypothetical protein
MYTAHQIINSIKVFNKRFTNQPQWNPDLVTYYKWARGKTDTEPEWKALPNDLDKDITTLKVEWTRKWPRTSRSFQHGEESKAGFAQKIDESFAIFQTILPKTFTALSQSQLLLRDCYEVEVPDWAHFRASALFYSYHLIKTEVSRFVWFMAGKQLTALKCYSRRGFSPAITPGMYAMLKEDTEYVRRAKANELMWDENMSVTNGDEIEDLGND